MDIKTYLKKHPELELLGYYQENNKDYYYLNNKAISDDPFENSLIVICDADKIYEYTIVQACLEDKDFNMNKMKDVEEGEL